MRLNLNDTVYALIDEEMRPAEVVALHDDYVLVYPYDGQAQPIKVHRSRVAFVAPSTTNEE